MVNESAEILDLQLPLWAHVPGQDGDADHATLAKAKALLPVRFGKDVPADHPAVRYGLALNDAGFFWEAHEILEAIWKLAPQGGRDRILLRACIQIANANLKLKMERLRAVERLLQDAQAELDELCVRSAGHDSEGFAERFDVAALALIVCRRLGRIGSTDGPICFGSA